MSANVILVDSQDQPIGIKARTELDHSKDIFRCTGLWVVNSQREVLIAQRSLSKKNSPGKWGPAAAGTVEENETYESNILKEAEEELGLKSFEFILGPKVFLRDARPQFGQWFLAKIDQSLENFILQKEEVEQVNWIKEKDLIDEVVSNPQKYISSMSQAIEVLYENGRNKYI